MSLGGIYLYCKAMCALNASSRCTVLDALANAPFMASADLEKVARLVRASLIGLHSFTIAMQSCPLPGETATRIAPTCPRCSAH